MTVQSAVRPTPRVLVGELRRRAARHYAPLLAASGVLLLLFMGIAFFNANRYPPPPAIFDGGVLNGVIPDDQPTSFQSNHEAPTGASPQGDDQPRTGSRPARDGAPTGDPPTSPGGPADGGPPARDGAGQARPAPGGSQAEAAPPPQAAHGQDPTRRLMRRLSTATGYIALGLLALTLLIGPANLLRRRPNPVSSYLRRDVGICAAATSVAHVVFGLLVRHSEGVLDYFFAADGGLLGNSFGLANYTGLAATVIVVGLAAVSSNAALRKLKARNWKRIQRLNYVLFGLVIAHSLLYGALWRATSPYTVFLGLLVVGVLVGQALGVRRYRQNHARAATAPT